MACTVPLAWLVLVLVLSGCFGIFEPAEPRLSGHVQGSVVAAVPEDATVVNLDSSTIPEESHVAAAVRAAVAEHDRLSGDGTAIAPVNASELVTVEQLLDDVNTSYVRYEEHVVEVTVWREG